MMQLREHLESWGIPTAPVTNKHNRRGWVNVNCPQCSFLGSDKYHLGINEDSWQGNCWQCGKVSVFNCIKQLVPRLPHESVAKAFNSRVKYTTREVVKHTGRYGKPKTHKLRKGHHEYLQSRGLDSEKVEHEWNLECTLSNAPKWEGLDMRARIFIPVIVDGKPVTWTSRSILPKGKPRYIAAPNEHEAVPIKSIAFGLDKPTHTAIIVEGSFDAMRIGRGAVATMGTAFKAGQVRQLGKFMRRVICFDNSSEAQKAADRLAHELATYPGETLIVQIEGDDPASAPESEIIQLRNNFL